MHGPVSIVIGMRNECPTLREAAEALIHGDALANTAQ